MDCAASDWAGSGLACLTGPAGGPPDCSRAAVLAEARRVTADIAELTGVEVDAGAVLAGRAALLGLTRQGRVCPGGATRLLRSADGWCAIALPRADDVAAVPALLGAEDAPVDLWQALSDWTATHSTRDVVTRAQLLDIAAAALGEVAAAAPSVRRIDDRSQSRGPDGLLVADLSSLWAGPLCGQLLARAGAVVVKVESPTRPDGTRRGDPAFFDWMNSGKLCYAVDFDKESDALRELLSAADVVIEGSRPGALRRRELSVDDPPARPGRVWLRIGGYAGQPDRPAFGDDAAVAGGLVGDGPVFCGDAIADPLSGLEATRAVLQSLRRGGGELIEVSMAQVAARYAALPRTAPTCDAPVAAPQPPAPLSAASRLGADNAAVRQLVAERLCAPC
ncbi:CoA transferase [Mycobacterium shimoidei]|uniref:CoA transferase n=1 Tax=Mycobacterium shimoidei TaxID=29313 RepID=UPI00084836FC|nr:CoA transferase [Mycobacterium shimoidei]MCV7258567.1 CoA transferase [Mycobacterium shimoidei]ODR15487.1 acyl-CoA transferase [Mycobacterium shimoidei]ORW83658.1 acyl-CoA transferase [Mycobacterium shimoidei]